MSVGTAAFVLAGAVVANLLAPLYLSSMAQAQSAPPAISVTSGNPLVGPNDAQVRPVLPDVTGVPMVVILEGNEALRSSWGSSLERYKTASPLVIRISDVSAQTQNTNWQRAGTDLASLLSSINRTDAIVVFGNELNNLDREWKSVMTAPTDDFVKDQLTRRAAQDYAVMYTNFKAGLGASIKLSPAPPDVTNGVYGWEEWIEYAGVYQSANALVMNAYNRPDIGKTIEQLIAEYQGKTGKTVDFFTEVGIDPKVTDLNAHLQFLNTAALPAPAAALVPNHCQSGGWGDGANIDDWLFYVKGQLYDRTGNVIDPSTCGANTVQIPDGKPVFLYPNPNDDINTFSQELDMYLANSQVYCAPPQVFWPERPVTADTITLRDGTQVGPEDYPNVTAEEETSLVSMSFPLFRSDRGGISVESDLSRVKAGQTLADALRKNSRVDSAPQFYLSTPQNQCLTAARYVKYVIDLCKEDGYDTTNLSNEELEKCGANLSIKMMDGEYRRITELATDEYLKDEAACENYTLDDVALNTPRARAVQAISPYTPKLFKMGFYVQHTFLSGSQNKSLWNSSMRNATQLIAWFTGQESGTFDDVNEPQERVDVVPVWYHAGLVGSEFDTDQLEPYSIDLRDYSVDGSIQPKNFDPTARTEQKRSAQATGTVINPKTSTVAEPITDPTNYAGPLWRTYSFVLPHHVQENIALRKLQLTYQNYYLLQFMRNSLGHPRTMDRQEIVNGIGADVISMLRLEKEQFWGNAQYTLPFECSLGGNNSSDPAFRGCTQFRESPYDPAVGYDGLPLAQTYSEIGAAFPEPVTINSRSQLDLLKKSLVSRINAGIQVTRAYTPTPAEGELVGPVSRREIGTACRVDQANIRRGIEETAKTINSSAIQNLQGPTDEPTDPPRNPITRLTNQISAWIYGGPHPAGDQAFTDRVTSAYLILPDEAMGIETLQSYVSTMFLSPEMYQSIMTGENEVYPFAEVWQQLMAGADFSDSAELQLSAFMRTTGPLRSVTGEEEGFVQAQRKAYVAIQTGCPAGEAGTGVCACGDAVPVNEPPVWMTLDEYEASGQPSTDNFCQGYEEITRRTVNLKGEQPGKNPDAGVSVPGNTFAMGEFLRRLAFTPLHQQKNAVYTGLENFYKGLGQLGGAGSGAVVGGQCAYSTPEVYDIRDQGYVPGTMGSANETINADICEAARVGNVDGSLVRALLSIEGGGFRNALSNNGDEGGTKYKCAPNSYGAIGPFQRVIGQCSTQASTQNFFLQDNTKNPDMCTLKGSMPALSRHLTEIEAYVKTKTSAPRGSLEYYTYMAESYLGRGSCGSLTNPADGAKAMPTEADTCLFTYGTQTIPCNKVDYCAYVADRATEEYGNYCR
jgi:hypothetical protein